MDEKDVFLGYFESGEEPNIENKNGCRLKINIDEAMDNETYKDAMNARKNTALWIQDVPPGPLGIRGFVLHRLIGYVIYVTPEYAYAIIPGDEAREKALHNTLCFAMTVPYNNKRIVPLKIDYGFMYDGATTDVLYDLTGFA